MTTSKIENFTRANVKDLAAEIKEAAAKIAAEYGVNLEYKGGSFSDNHFNLKLEFRTLTDGEFISEGRKALEMLYPNMVDKVVDYFGKPVTIIEYHHKKTKFPFIAKAEGGGMYKLTRSQAEPEATGKQASINHLVDELLQK